MIRLECPSRGDSVFISPKCTYKYNNFYINSSAIDHGFRLYLPFNSSGAHIDEMCCKLYRPYCPTDNSRILSYLDLEKGLYCSLVRSIPSNAALHCGGIRTPKWSAPSSRERERERVQLPCVSLLLPP